MNKFLVLLVFSTNIAHALDLYLVLMRRTHFKQGVRGDDPPNSTSGSSKLITMRHIRLSPNISFKNAKQGGRRRWHHHWESH
jgi:hypothetical protein